jgi:hypothetical protein
MRNGILGSLAALLAGSGIALGQGYYPGYPPAGYYPPAAWQQMPMRPVPMQPMPMPMQPMPGRPNLVVGPNGQMMPAPWYPGGVPIYAQPYYPVVRGWPPPAVPQYSGKYPQYTGTYFVPPAPAAAPGQSPSAKGTGSGPLVTTTFPPLPSSARNESTLPDAAAAYRPLPGRKAAPVTVTTLPPAPDPMLDPVPGTPLRSHDTCTDGSCGGCQTCSPVCGPLCEPSMPCRAPRGYRVYGGLETLYWWIRRGDGPTLFTVMNARGTSNIGVVDLINWERLGGRATLGYWFNPDQTIALEASGFLMGNRNAHTLLSPPTIISRPFFNLTTGAPNTMVLPAGSSADIAYRTRLYGAEINLRWDLYRWSSGHLDFLTGARFLQLDESIDIGISSLGKVSGERFGTHNQLWASQVGIETEMNRGRYFMNNYAKLAYGDLRETVNIAGAGLLVQGSNARRYTRDHFGWLPDTGTNVGMRLTDNIRVFGGYSLWYLFNAVRPGDQIDNRLGAGPGGIPTGPLFRWNDTSFWAQGLTGGLEIRY